MLVSKRLNKTATRHLGMVLATTVVMPLILQAQVQAQDVGPVAPPPKPPLENSVGKALGAWLKGTKKPENPNAQPKVDRTLTKDDNYLPGGQQPMTTPTKRTAPVQPTTMAPAVQHPPLLVQPPLNNAKIDTTVVDSENPPNLTHPKLDDPNNPLGFADAEIKLKHFSQLVTEKRYVEAKPGLIQLRQSLVDLTEAHIGLYKTLNQVPSARGQAELEKELALEFAQLRDRAMLETAKVYISEREYNKAVKELADVVKSQPRSKLGLRSYEMLQEIGFTEKLQLTQ